MASTLSAACFVRCPKCLRVLAELPDIPLFKCYGCDAILKAKVLSDNCSSDIGLALYVKQISTASDEPKRSEDSKSNGEKNFKELEFSDNGIMTLSVSESNESGKVKRESAVYELNDINERSLEHDEIKPSSQSAHSLNQNVKKSSNQIVPAEAIDSLDSSHMLEEQYPESLEYDVKNKEGNEEHTNGVGSRWKSRSSHGYDRSFSLSDKQRQDHVTQKHLVVSRRTRSSHAYDRSFSSSDEHQQDHAPQQNLALSRRTQSRKVLNSAESIEATGRENVVKNSTNVEEQPVAEKHHSKFSNQSSGNGVQAKEQNIFSAENHELSLISQSKDSEKAVKFRFSETDDQLNILEKVDKLKIELHRMFSNKPDEKEASSISIKVTRFEGKIELNDNRSSLFRFSRQPSNSSCLLCHSAGMSCRDGTRRLCHGNQLRHCRPVAGGAPFVICYKCYKLLQLPVDFLVSTKMIHKLRCGSCSEVLVYSFRPRSHAGVNKRS